MVTAASFFLYAPLYFCSIALRSARGRLAKVEEGDAFPAILFGVEGRNSHMIEVKRKLGVIASRLIGENDHFCGL
jgi:hypothetical protein